jgi:hypothetical protein
MTYFNEAYVTERYKITTEELQSSIEAKPIGFPKPHIVEGEKVWAGEDLTMWDTCRLLDRITAHAEAAKADLNALLDELYAL